MTNGRQKTVLIFEDEPLVAMLLEEMVREAGFTTLPVPTNPEEAAAASESAMADIAILDANLWGKTCTDYADTLRGRGIPFVLSSGYSNSELQSRFGADTPLLPKPYKFSELQKVLQDAA